MDNEQLKSNLLSTTHWLRLVFMVLFAVILYVAGIVMSFLVVVQFIFALLSGRDNPNLRQLGDSLSQFTHAALRFLTYNTDDKPFPFDEWPRPAPVEPVWTNDSPEHSATADGEGDDDASSAGEADSDDKR